MEERRWHRFYDFWVPRSLTYPRQPLSALLDFAANQYGERTATIFYGATLSYRDLRSQSLRLATALDALGIRPGDRVGLMLPNCPQFLIAFYAILRLGAVVVPLNPAHGDHGLPFAAAGRTGRAGRLRHRETALGGGFHPADRAAGAAGVNADLGQRRWRP
ncbi:MAG: hypothetical protein C4313_02330 [Thermoflexus sp.]